MKSDIVIIILMAVAVALLLICTPLLIARIETLKEELEKARLPVRCYMILKHPRGFESITPVLGVLNLQATPDQDMPSTTYISFDVMTPYQGDNRRATP